MLEKLKSDELITHKIGVILGAILGFIFGMFISKAADEYVEYVEELEIEERLEEVEDEPTNDEAE